MNPLRFRAFLALVLVSTLAGCAGSGSLASWNPDSSDDGHRTPAGWGAPVSSQDSNDTPTATDDNVEDQELGEATCFVKAPNIPGPPETIQVLKRPERDIPGTDAAIAAEYVTVETFPANFDGFAWLPAVCDESVNRHLISRIQEALIEKGYDIGTVDGVAGPSTKAGLEYFKRDNGIYGEGYTHEVLEALGVDPKTGGPAFAGI